MGLGIMKGALLVAFAAAVLLALAHPAHAYTTADYESYGGLDADDTVYVSAEKYLLFLRGYCHETMKGLRIAMGAGEIKAGKTRWKCTGVISCILGGPGYSVSPGAGYTSVIEVAGIFLNSATVSTVSAFFMHFVLRYISGGFLLFYLPLGLALRSVSITRPLGSTLVAISLTLYIFYPLMLVLNSMIFPSIAGNIPDLGPYSNEQYMGGLEVIYRSYDAPSMDSLVRWTAYSFFGAIFLPAVDFVIIVALARETGHLLGEEIDISRLSQMV
jgi:hypothetical protein